MDTETRRQLEQYRDDAARKHAQSQRVFEMIIAIATALLEDDAPPQPVSRRRPHPHLKLVRGLLIGGAAALAGRLLTGHKTAAVASLTATALAAPLVAVPLILSIPSPSAPARPVHHVRRRDPAPPAPAVTRRPAADPASVPALPRRNVPPAPVPSASPAPAPSPALSPGLLLIPGHRPRKCLPGLIVAGICLRL